MALKDIKTKPVNTSVVVKKKKSKILPKGKSYQKDPRKVESAFQTNPAQFDSYNRRYGNMFNKAWTDSAIEQLADEMYEWFVKNRANIWLYEFCNEKMVSKFQISNFVKKNEYFAFMHTLCLDMQETKLVEHGLNPEIKPTMVIFILKNSHGWTDRKEIKVNEVDGIKFIED